MGQKSTILAVGLIIFAVILVILFIVSRVIGGGNENTAADQNTIQNVESVDEQFEDLVPVSKIISNPTVYNGYDLSVSSRITDWATNRSFYFTGESQGIFGGQSSGILLVITQEAFQLPQDPNDSTLGLGENADITATGRIVLMNREQIESTLGVSLDDPQLELGNQVLNRWSLGPVLLMNSYVINSSN